MSGKLRGYETSMLDMSVQSAHGHEKKGLWRECFLSIKLRVPGLRAVVHITFHHVLLKYALFDLVNQSEYAPSLTYAFIRINPHTKQQLIKISTLPPSLTSKNRDGHFVSHLLQLRIAGISREVQLPSLHQLYTVLSILASKSEG